MKRASSRTFISLCTLVIFIGLSIASLALLGSEDADRMREKARLINMIIINVWMVVVSLFMMFWGNEVFSVKRRGNLGMGMLYGGCKYFSSLLLLVCFLFASFSFDQRENEESTWVGCKCIFCRLDCISEYYHPLLTRSPFCSCNYICLFVSFGDSLYVLG